MHSLMACFGQLAGGAAGACPAGTDHHQGLRLVRRQSFGALERPEGDIARPADMAGSELGRFTDVDHHRLLAVDQLHGFLRRNPSRTAGSQLRPHQGATGDQGGHDPIPVVEEELHARGDRGGRLKGREEVGL